MGEVRHEPGAGRQHEHHGHNHEHDEHGHDHEHDHQHEPEMEASRKGASIRSQLIVFVIVLLGLAALIFFIPRGGS